jgi:4-oxalocrotonate tautomerase
MPFVNIRTVKGLLTPDQKLFLIERFTELLIEVEGRGNPDFRKTISILIEEDEPINCQIGELRPTVEMIQELPACHNDPISDCLLCTDSKGNVQRLI